MKPRESQSGERQDELFQLRLSEMLDARNPLYRLAQQIDWAALDQEFGALYHAEIGRPGLPTRLLVGLHAPTAGRVATGALAALPRSKS